MQRSKDFISTHQRNQEIKEAQTRADKLCKEQERSMLQKEASGSVMDVNIREAFLRKMRQNMFQHELGKIEKLRQERYKDQASKMASRDEIISAPVYQAMMCEAGFKGEDYQETAENVRKAIVEHYTKQNQQKVRKLTFTIDAFLTTTLAEQMSLKMSEFDKKKRLLRERSTKNRDLANIDLTAPP